MKCCVITPVGPGHQELSLRLVASVQQAIDNGTGPFSDVHILPIDDSKGQGRSRARNLGVKQAGELGADWIFFIDADDLMAPDAFLQVENLVDDYDAIWGAIFEADTITQSIKRRHNEISPLTSLEQVLINHPFLTLHNGHFVRYEAAANEPFNTEMDCGEDFEYYLRIWRSYRAIKIEKPIFYNIRGQHSTGPRAATGSDWNVAMPRIFSDFCRNNEVIASVPFSGKEVKFRLSNTLDLIQNRLAREQFFELKELTETLLVLPRNARIFDVGTNIGNHALFFSQIGNAKHVHCFEPSPLIADLLQTNFHLNEIASERYSVERIGVGAEPARASYDHVDPTNLGATSIKQDSNGDLEIDSLDNRFPRTTVDLLKIDVEGMEMEVLAGAKGLIERNRPVLLIEVSNRSKAHFLAWISKNDYRIHRAFELVYAANYLVLPNKLREGFYDAGVAASRDWTPSVPLASNQPPCGWSIADFLTDYFGCRRALELIAIDSLLVALDSTEGKRVELPNGTQDFGLRFPETAALLGELLGQITDSLLSNILDGLAKSTQEIVLFDLMDARWNHAFRLNHRYRDAEWYICQLGRRGYRLHNYQKLPHKAALGAGEQLDSRITLLHFKKG